MRRLGIKSGVFFLSLIGAGLFVSASAQAAREASFLNPMSATTTTTAAVDAVLVEPKGDIDVGESSVDIARRVALFFVNQTNAPVTVSGVTINGDSSLNSSIVSDDCSKEGKIAPNSRCSMVISITPVNAGPWSAEVLLTHNAAGRIARAKISGKSKGGVGTAADKDAGLSLSTKEIKAIDFGKVEPLSGQAVRSALMVNDSQDPITLMAIDLIAADNGLARLEQGCSLDMDLKPGESCPVTLVWKPTVEGAVSTDLIIRHSGKMGFVVVPVRGVAQATVLAAGTSGAKKGAADGGLVSTGPTSKIKAPPTADELEKAVAGGIPPIAASEMGMETTKAASTVVPVFHLVGTVGNRGVFVKPDGTTVVASGGDEVSYDEGKAMTVLSVAPRSAEIQIGEKKKMLKLESADALTSKATNKSARSVTLGGSELGDKSSGKKSSKED